MQHTQSRVQFLDILRGVAVIIMVMGHSVDAVLSVEVRSSEWFRAYDSLRGFTAPIFLLLSGFAFSVVAERKWELYRKWNPVLVRRLARMLFLVVLGYALHLPFFSFNKLVHNTQPDELARMLQVDVLQSLAVSILVLQAVVAFSPSPAVYGRIAGGLAIGAAFVTPLFWGVDMAQVVTSPLAPYFNQREASLFPLFPNSAFLFAGAAVGQRYLLARNCGGEERFFGRLAIGGLLAVVLSIALDRFPVGVYPPHDYWKANPGLILLRTGMVLAYVTLFYYFRNIPAFFARRVAALGRSSLVVYVAHLLLVYGSAANSGLMQRVGQTLPPLAAFGVALCVLLSMVGLVSVWRYAQEQHTLPSRLVRIGLATSVLYMFFARPY